MTFAKKCNEIFDRATRDYHVSDHVDAARPTPFDDGTVEAVLYHKNWIDAVQWHLEDIIRDPAIDPCRRSCPQKTHRPVKPGPH